MKFRHPSCDSKMTFQECEMAILRAAVDKAGEVQSKRVVNSAEVQKMISIVEQFLRRKRLVCYGGTAINALTLVRRIDSISGGDGGLRLTNTRTGTTITIGYWIFRV